MKGLGSPVSQGENAPLPPTLPQISVGTYRNHQESRIQISWFLICTPPLMFWKEVQNITSPLTVASAVLTVQVKGVTQLHPICSHIQQTPFATEIVCTLSSGAQGVQHEVQERRCLPPSQVSLSLPEGPSCLHVVLIFFKEFFLFSLFPHSVSLTLFPERCGVLVPSFESGGPVTRAKVILCDF